MLSQRYRLPNNMAYQSPQIYRNMHPYQQSLQFRVPYYKNIWIDGNSILAQYQSGDINTRQVGGGTGGGASDLIKGTMEMIKAAKEVGRGVVDAYTSSNANKLRNVYSGFINTNPKWAPGYPGELHMMTKKGIGYNFCGPNTNLDARLARGDVGINKLDSLCKKHDIDYSKARDLNDVHAADKVFVKKVGKLKNTSPSTKAAVRTAIKSKMFVEKTGLIEPYHKGGGDPARKLRNQAKKYLKKSQPALHDFKKKAKKTARRKSVPSQTITREQIRRALSQIKNQ